MEEIIYFDKFENCYKKEMDKNVPPERYIEITQSEGSYYGEVWYCGNYNMIDVYYDEAEKEFADIIRKDKGKEHGVKLTIMKRWIVPKHDFEEILGYLKNDMLRSE